MRDGLNGTRASGRVPRTPVRPVDPDVSGPTSLGRLPVVLERLPDGRHRLTSPDLPGFQAVGRGPHELARNVDQAWTELQIAAYSANHGQAYDLAHHAVRAEGVAPRVQPLTRSTDGTRVWRYSHDPGDWRPLPGGDWESPTGRRYRGDSEAVAKVMARRQVLGLPNVAPEEAE